MIAGARVEVAPYKKDPGDFVLWKPSSPDQPGWDSPWGRGRPGWHIECSAMSEAHLGDSFDIHGGGLDLIFPHHENELAQSECAHGGKPFVNFWVHNGFLSVDSTKMSKSLGNFVTVHELLEAGSDRGLEGEAIRLALLSTHYRDPLDWTDEKLSQARSALDRFYRVLALPSGQGQASMAGSVVGALEDDLNTPLALVVLHSLASEINKTTDPDRLATLQSALRSGAALLGLLQGTWRQGDVDDETNSINRRVDERTKARRERRFADADRIRAELAAEAITLEDRPDGTTTWYRDWAPLIHPPDFVIPGRRVAANAESIFQRPVFLDSGFAAFSRAPE